jgi:hypothetical protein
VTLGGLGLGVGTGAGVARGWFQAWLSMMAWSSWNWDSSSLYCSLVIMVGEAGEAREVGEMRLKPSSAVRDGSNGEGVPE